MRVRLKINLTRILLNQKIKAYRRVLTTTVPPLVDSSLSDPKTIAVPTPPAAAIKIARSGSAPIEATGTSGPGSPVGPGDPAPFVIAGGASYAERGEIMLPHDPGSGPGE